ncbi:hypothetical protein BROSI_A1237 [Candidatus Brocadia sinica JPN1]|uniref:Uncharacterized protein n=1 Tax=Candidatus Brocadia sinica JPN1 TaxID=1197129 RepID=A0ABQ0JVG4_9BACT|nr:hypothetical protein BROSI_A1237 [Candidatus Brocadia sinica JPN1]
MTKAENVMLNPDLHQDMLISASSIKNTLPIRSD